MSTLKEIMSARGLRQKSLAEALAVSEPSVSRWVNREANIPVQYIEPIARLLGVEPSTVLAVAVAAEAAA